MATTASVVEKDKKKASTSSADATITAKDQAGKTISKTVGTVEVEDLQTDSRWNRPVSKRAHVMGADWNPSLAQAIVVSKRKDGTQVVIDGQHRAAAARIAGVRELIAEIHEGLTETQEAELFDRLNTTRATISALDRFRARIFYQDPTAVSIKKAVEDRGGEIRESIWRGSRQKNEIAAIWSLERVYLAGGEELLDWVLDTIKDSFEELSADTVSLLNVSGLLMFWRKHGENIDREHLVGQLRQVGWLGVRQRMHAHRQLWGGTGAVNGYRAMVELYNQHLATNKKLQP